MVTALRRPFAVAFVILAGLLLSACGVNTIPTYDQQAKAAWSNVLNQYQRRADLIPNLVETVKGYAKQEQAVIGEVANARAALLGAHTKQDEITANNQLSGAIGRLLVLQENYPQLKSNENFLRLQDELAGTENRIAVERRKYNETVQKYNTDIELFPNNIAAGLFNFQRDEAYFKTDPGARTAPKVAF